MLRIMLSILVRLKPIHKNCHSVCQNNKIITVVFIEIKIK